jgi:glycine/D-amino acid oxidase-like deaminating enzyme
MDYNAASSHVRGAVQFMRTAEVVIIGGGIVGSSTAYHLTAAQAAKTNKIAITGAH